MEPQAEQDWNRLVSFPSSQETPEVALFEGYVEGKRDPETTAWKIMTRFGPAMLADGIGETYEVEPESRVKLHPRARLRKEVFGGVVYRDGITLAVNKPAYGILANLSAGDVKAGDISSDILKELTRYNLLQIG